MDLMPRVLRSRDAPIPESWRSCGELTAPAATMTSLLALSVLALFLWITSIPTARLFRILILVALVSVKIYRLGRLAAGCRKADAEEHRFPFRVVSQ